MAITSNVVVKEGEGNDSATNFPTGYLIYAKEDVLVKLDGVTQTEGTHYTVTGLGTEAAQVEFITAPATGVKVLLIKNVPYTQEIDFIQGNKFSADSVEKALDTTTILSQQTLNELKKTPKAPSTVTSAFDGEMANYISEGFIRAKTDSTGFLMVSTSDLAAELAIAAMESPVPISLGGTGATTLAGAKANLEIKEVVLSDTLTSMSTLGTAADKYLYTTSLSTWTEGDITTFGRSLLDDADAATASTTLGLGTTDNVSFLNGDFTGTEALKIPVGTTAERPSVPADGDLRVNSTSGTTEIYRNLDWRDLENSANGGGKVLQVQSFTFDNIFSTANTTWTDTGIEIAITPSSTDSKVYINCTASGSCSSSTYYVNYRLVRNSTAIAVGAAAGGRTLVSGTTSYGAIRPTHSMTASYLDSPATTLATTYKLQISAMSGSSTTVYINRSPTDTDNVAYPRGASTITVMEIGV